MLVPFDVPAGTTAVRVKYCYDQPELADARRSQPHARPRPLRRARRGRVGRGEFRGWGGSSHPDVTVSPQGFSTEEQYRDAPEGPRARPDDARLPARADAGRARGRPSSASPRSCRQRAAATSTASVAWRVEIELATRPRVRRRALPAGAATTRARRAPEPGWYAGDLHVHAEHSALGDATMRETFDYAFGDGRGSTSSRFGLRDGVGWGEIGRHQAALPGQARSPAAPRSSPTAATRTTT